MAAPGSVLIAGAGSLGTLYGACLARGGCDVQLLARPAHAEAVTGVGHVVVEDPAGDWTAPLRATADPAAVEPVQTLVLLSQAQDSAAVLAGLGHLGAELELALSLQNGGGTARPLQDAFGPAKVAGGTSMVGATLVAPGRVALTSPATTYLGELDDRVSDRTETFGARLRAGGLDVLVTDRVRSAEWSKLVNAAAAMALTALPRLPMHTAFADPATSVAYAELVKEGAAIAAADGVALEDWPGMVPAGSVARAPLAEAAELVAQRGRLLEEAGQTAIVTSMRRSVETGRPLEVGAVFGFLRAEAQRHGVDAPRIGLAWAMLDAIDRRNRAA